ncbi:hypothetical protein [Cupriavidus necator]
MATIEYNLFRVNFIRLKQRSLFEKPATAEAIFLQAIDERPSGELRKGYRWHIGNVEFFSPRLGYFAIGRTTNSTIEKFDSETGDFIEEELEASPYTHCVFNSHIGFVGIAKKSSLSLTAKGVAKRLEQLLSKTRAVALNGVTVEIHPIPDPDGFLKIISSAYKVTKFSATFHGPNPFDADELFQKPLAVYLQAANGIKGRTQIQGEDLSRDVLESVTRSTAATGNEASARILKSKGQKPLTINLRGDPIKKKYDEDAHDPEVVVNDLTRIYQSIRENGAN